MRNTYLIKECGKRIRQLRKEHGITQEQLAAKLNIGERHMRKIEMGEKGPSVDILVELTELFEVSLDYIILGKRPESKLKQRLKSVIQTLSALEKDL